METMPMANFLCKTDFEALRRLDISDPESHIRRRFKDEDLTFVGNVCVGPSLIDQIDAAIDDALVSGNWVDIYVSM